MSSTSILDRFTDSEAADRERGTVVWLRTWIALGSIVIFVVIAYVLFISNSLSGINTNLQVARDAVTDVNGNTKTLPDQIDTVNENLTDINKSLKPIPGQAQSIRDNLTSISAKGKTINSSLTDTNVKLVEVAEDLTASIPQLNKISSQLTDTSSLLRSILTSTGEIDENLVDIKGSGSSGVATVNSNVKAINAALAPTKKDLGNILTGLTSINGHLTKVCRSAPINLLHGKQPC